MLFPPHHRLPTARRLGRTALALTLLVGQILSSAPVAGAASGAPAGRPFVAFGPSDSERQAGAPATTTSTFTLTNPAAPYTLRVSNGGLTGQYTKVSSATLSLNGTPIMGPSDFNQTVATIEKPISPGASNQLAVQLQSQPGAGLTVEVIGLDDDPPTISASVSPTPNAAGWNKTDATVSFSCADKTSGIATCPSPTVVSAEGANQPVSGTATDKAGNTASASATVNLDKTAPTVNITAPSAGSSTKDPTPTLSAGASDTLSGVATVQFQLSTNNGAAWTNVGTALTAAPYQLAVPTALADGSYQVRALATDLAGNQAASPAATFLVDTTPPTVSISQPVPNATTNSRAVAASASDGAGSGVARVQLQLSGDSGATWTDLSSPLTAAPYQTTLPTHLADGAYQVRAQATDAAGNQATSAIVPFTLETTAPHTAITGHPDASTTGTSASFVFSSDQAGTTFACQLDGAPVSPCTSPQPYTSLAVGNHTFAVRGTDPAGNVEATPASFSWAITAQAPLPPPVPQAGPVPPDPATIAPPVEAGVPTSLASGTSFLYSGPNPIQTGVAPGTIQAQRAAVLRGKVLTRDGQPLPGVRVAVKDHPEFGQTISRVDGQFDLAVNGGGLLTITYAKDGYLAAQRQVQAPWQDYAWASDVVLVQQDTQVSTIDLTSTTPIQVARGSVQTDASGSRQATVLFPQGTTAQLAMPDGSTRPLASLHVRATEYTVGPNGPQAMPGDLPPASGYTYAAEFGIDEAAAAGATHVVFSQALPVYVDNFLHIQVGDAVPSGFYDPARAEWVPSPDGRVIQILGVTGGAASLDVDGSGQPANAQALTTMGISQAELQQLASLYQPGQSLWRVPVTHFSGYDFNWPYGFPKGAQTPNVAPPIQDNLLDHSDLTCGSVIECENQALGEDVAVAGTPYHLHYESDVVPGRKSAYTLNIPVSGPSVPPSLSGIELTIEVAGVKKSVSFPPNPNQAYTFVWDGKDAYGRMSQGQQLATIQISYVYGAVYLGLSDFSANVGGLGGVPIGTSSSGLFGLPSPPGSHQAVNLAMANTQRLTVSLVQVEHALVGALNPQGLGLGGWTLDVHDTFDPTGHVMHFGDGTSRNGIVGGDTSNIIETFAGAGAAAGAAGDGGSASQATVFGPNGIAAGPDGSIYVAENGANRVRRISADGTISTVAGTGAAGFNGDGGPAAQAALNGPHAVALGPDGSMYVADSANARIRRIANGTITTVAGVGSPGFSGDGGAATHAQLNFPTGVAVAPDGTLYIADWRNKRVRRVGPDGIITTAAGNGQGCCLNSSGDGGLATQASVSGPVDVALARDGTLYIADLDGTRSAK